MSLKERDIEQALCNYLSANNGVLLTYRQMELEFGRLDIVTLEHPFSVTIYEIKRGWITGKSIVQALSYKQQLDNYINHWVWSLDSLAVVGFDGCNVRMVGTRIDPRGYAYSLFRAWGFEFMKYQHHCGEISFTLDVTYPDWSAPTAAGKFAETVAIAYAASCGLEEIRNEKVRRVQMGINTPNNGEPVAPPTEKLRPARERMSTAVIRNDEFALWKRP